MNIKVRNQIAEKLGVNLSIAEHQTKGAVRYAIRRGEKLLGIITSKSSGGFLADELERKITELPKY
ncbi:MAG: hypothetical protein V1848_03235 [Candidatus Magasanikbacteria bacterium]